MIDVGAPEPRRLSPLLLVAVICVPALFCWLLLRRGYSASLRRAGFVYAGAITAVGVIGHFG